LQSSTKNARCPKLQRADPATGCGLPIASLLGEDLDLGALRILEHDRLGQCRVAAVRALFALDALGVEALANVRDRRVRIDLERQLGAARLIALFIWTTRSAELARQMQMAVLFADDASPQNLGEVSVCRAMSGVSSVAWLKRLYLDH